MTPFAFSIVTLLYIGLTFLSIATKRVGRRLALLCGVVFARRKAMGHANRVDMQWHRETMQKHLSLFPSNKKGMKGGATTSCPRQSSTFYDFSFTSRALDPKSSITDASRLTRSSSSPIPCSCSATVRCTSGNPSTTARAFCMRILIELVSVGRSLMSSGGGTTPPADSLGCEDRFSVVADGG